MFLLIVEILLYHSTFLIPYINCLDGQPAIVYSNENVSTACLNINNALCSGYYADSVLRRVCASDVLQ